MIATILSTTAAAAFELRFDCLFTVGRALVFPCDASGFVDLASLSERARKNYDYACLLVGHDFAAPAVMALTHK